MDTWTVRIAAVLSVAFVLYWCHANTASTHEFYKNRYSPSGASCCNDRDCAPVEVRWNEERMQLEVLLQGRWWPAEDPAWYLGVSPDGSWHG
jgi:hypothetical protein